MAETIWLIAYRYKGGVSVQWLESQPISYVFRLLNNLNKIVKNDNAV